MTDGILRVLRMYCDYDLKTLSEATGIAVQRLKRIEAGEEDASDEDIRKIASVFGVSADFLNGDERIDNGLLLRQPLEDVVFASEEEKEAAKLRVTELSDLEKKLILLIRCSENAEQALTDAINSVMNA